MVGLIHQVVGNAAKRIEGIGRASLRAGQQPAGKRKGARVGHRDPGTLGRVVVRRVGDHLDHGSVRCD
jgi:hypothetical protein